MVGQLEIAPADIEILRKGVTEKIVTPVMDRARPEINLPITSGTATLLNYNDVPLITTTFGPEGNDVVVREREGIYSILMDTTKFTDDIYTLAFSFYPRDEIRPVNITKVIRVLTGKYYRYMPQLRSILDKANKSVGDDLEFGYPDAKLALFMDLGVTRINSVSPFTNLNVTGFPESLLQLMFDAAIITAMEAQGILSIDMDYQYSLGGNSLVVDHWSKISAFLQNLIQDFNARLKVAKQFWRFKGEALVQLNYSYGYSRYLQAVPSFFFARFGVGVGSYNPQSGMGFGH